MEFPPILVINLADRKDRWDAMQDSFYAWPHLHRIDAIRKSPGWKGCIASHQKALLYAQKERYPWVLVLEDDCVPTSDAFIRFQNLLPLLWKNRDSWDIFLGGSTMITDASVIHRYPPLFRVKAHAAHFCLYTQPGYEKIIPKLSLLEIPIDAFYRNSNDIRMLCTVPHLATQQEGQSDIENTHVVYNSLFTDANKKLFDLTQESLEGFLDRTIKFQSNIFVYDMLTLATIVTIYLVLPR